MNANEDSSAGSSGLRAKAKPDSASGASRPRRAAQVSTKASPAEVQYSRASGTSLSLSPPSRNSSIRP